MRASLELLCKAMDVDCENDEERAIKNAVMTEISDALDALHDIRFCLQNLYEMEINKLHGR